MRSGIPVCKAEFGWVTASQWNVIVSSVVMVGAITLSLEIHDVYKEQTPRRLTGVSYVTLKTRDTICKVSILAH